MAADPPSGARPRQEHIHRPSFPVLALATLVLGVLTFAFTQQEGCQDTRRKGLEFRTELINRVTTEGTDAIVAGRRIIALPPPKATDADIDAERESYIDAREDWWRTTYSVAATVAANYSDDEIKNDWTDFAIAVQNYLRLSRPLGGDQDARDKTVQKLRRYFGGGAAGEVGKLRKWQGRYPDAGCRGEGLPSGATDPCPYNQDYFWVSYHLVRELDDMAERLSTAELTLY